MTLLAVGHPYRDGIPRQTSFNPIMGGGILIDSWIYSTVTPSGQPPDESLALAQYRAMSSIKDRTKDTVYAVTGDVRHTRPPMEPYGTIDTVRGPRDIHFSQALGVVSYLTIPADKAVGVASLSGATPTRPFRMVMQLKLVGGALRIGDGTLWAKGGWLATVNTALDALTITTPADTPGTTVFPWPNPVEGVVSVWVEFLFDGSAWQLKVNGENIAPTSTVVPSGTLASTRTDPLTIGGRTGNGYECSASLIAVGNRSEWLDRLSLWRATTPLQISGGYYIYPRDIIEPAYPNGIWHLFQGGDGSGLTVRIVDSLSTDAAADGSFLKHAAQSNTLAIVTVRGCLPAPTNQAGAGAILRTFPYGVIINASGGHFAFAGREFKPMTNSTGNTPATRAASHTGMFGIGGGGPYTYSTQYANAGAFMYVQGDDGGTFDPVYPLVNVILKDCWSAFTADNMLNFYRASNSHTVCNFFGLGPLRYSNHGEAPSHAFGILTSGSATRISLVSFYCGEVVQRFPNVYGNLGGELEHTVGMTMVAGAFITPRRNVASTFKGMVFGLPPGDPNAANSREGHLSVMATIMDHSTVGASMVTKTNTPEANGYPPESSTLYASGCHYRNGVLSNDPSALALVKKRPFWGAGEKHLPTSEAGKRTFMDALAARLPTFVRNLYERGKTDVLYITDMFTTNPDHINPGNQAGIDALNALLNPATTDWSVPANAAAYPDEFPGVATPLNALQWKSAEIQAAVNTKVAPEAGFRIAQPYMFNAIPNMSW